MTDEATDPKVAAEVERQLAVLELAGQLCAGHIFERLPGHLLDLPMLFPKPWQRIF